MRNDGEHRLLLRSIGIETGNLYAAFVAIALKMLRPGGELVAITPPSFCNGPYFKLFRRFLLKTESIDRVHIFEQADFSGGMAVRLADFCQIVKSDDPDMVIHVTPDKRAVDVERRIKLLPCTLSELGIEVSTGPVVDFRLKEYLHSEPEEGTFPLIGEMADE
jgi:adenine-specific DNA-methyltransferase